MSERIVTLRSPFPWQAEVLRSPARFKVCFVGRRAGKSETALISSLCGHGPTGEERRGALRGGHVWWVLPSFTLAVDAWDRLTAATKHVATRKSEVEKRVILHGGGSVSVKSSDNPDSLRGAGLDGVVLDELKDHGPKVWAESLRPTLADRQGWLLALGTPGAIGGWSHELFERAKRIKGDWQTWQLPSSVNPTLKTEELEDARATLGTQVFAREFEAQFVAGSGALFKREWVRFYDHGAGGLLVGDHVVPLDRLRRFAVADLAATLKTRSDWSVLGVFGVMPDGRLVVLEVFRRRLEGHEFIPAFKAVVERWQLGAVFVESSAYNNLFMGIARSEGIPIREIVADKDKVARAEPAVAALEGGRIWLPRGATWVDEFVSELCGFPEGIHDDQVDVLSYGVAVAAKSLSAAPTRAQVYRRDNGDEEDGRKASWQIGRD